MSRRICGFTLVELLVALGILSLLMLAGYRGLTSLMDSERHLAAEQEKWRTLSLFFDRLEADLQRALPRGVRVGTGTEPALLGASAEGGSARLVLSRAGDARPEYARSGQRIEYRHREDRIELVLWPAYDNAPEAGPQVLTLIEGVESWTLRFARGKLWVDRWPPPGSSGVLPQAVETTLRLRGGQPLQRLVVLP